MATPLFGGLKYSDSVTVVGISLCITVIYEAISWLFIYRTASYKSLKSSVDKSSKQLEQNTESTTASKAERTE
ncbi:hypothetical protein Dimus_021943, partial [Dionaea muscipula]